MSPITNYTIRQLVLSALVLIALAGCSSPNKQTIINPDTGKHPANWIVDHRAAFPNNPDRCAECHGTDLKGGVSGVSCFSAAFNGMSCHANGPSGHPAGWANPDSHGATAKATPAASSGFASCQVCHGETFSGGIIQRSCINTAGCHGATIGAPHSPAPWRGGTRTHTDTDTGNAPVCALCHANGANSSRQPFEPAPAGTAPGCFNNTLCHAVTGHAAGWSSPDVHGASVKTLANGFASCQACHGADFAGGTALISCFNCHGVNAPHSPTPWRSLTRTHANTNTGNASVCALCHTNGANSSRQPSPPAPAGTAAGCFNNTLCHAEQVHAAGWIAADQHGVTAEQDFSVCKTCHGATYQGGTATTTCYQCHNGPGLNHPAPAWVVPDHKTQALTDSIICQKCHGTDYLGGGSHNACNSCHMENQTKVHRINWYPDVRFNHSAYAKANGTTSCSNVYCHGANLTGVTLSGPSCSTCHIWPLNLADCASCHGTPPTGAVFPNIAGRHSEHTALSTNIVCATCHEAAGSGTTLHINNVADVFIDQAYRAKTGGAALYNATGNTCANVSCHGGQTTPAWLTGTINVDTQCSSCHASGTAQYNSYNSGKHSEHIINAEIACTTCHDTTLLVNNHFTRLDTTTMEGPASATISSALTYTPGATPGTGTCTPLCHGTRSW